MDDLSEIIERVGKLALALERLRPDHAVEETYSAVFDKDGPAAADAACSSDLRALLAHVQDWRPAREQIALAICKSDRFETGEGSCAVICMDQLGSPRQNGCWHAERVHRRIVDAILSLLPPSPTEGAEHG